MPIDDASLNDLPLIEKPCVSFAHYEGDLPPMGSGKNYENILTLGERVSYLHERSMLLKALEVRKTHGARRVVHDFMRIAEIAAQQGSHDLAIRCVEKSLLASGYVDDCEEKESLLRVSDVTVYTTKLSGRRHRMVIFHRPDGFGDITSINGCIRPDQERDRAVMHQSKGWEQRREILLGKLVQWPSEKRQLKPLRSLSLTKS